MANDQGGSAVHWIRVLFEVGAVGQRADAELLDRFVSGAGEAAELAFAALVERYGPMVFRVGRQILRDEHDAQDAFQAVFLVLARRAHALHARTPLGPWLHQVTLRTAYHIRAGAARRARHELKAAERVAESMTDRNLDDLGGALQEELGRLPPKYHLPLVLCYMEGLTNEQAALQLGWPAGTVRSRLHRGRERLRMRLARRGLAPSIAVVTATLAPDSAWSAVPRSLVDTTARAAVLAAGGHIVAGVVPASIVALSEGVLRAMAVTKWTTALLVAVLACSGVGGLVYSLSVAAPQEPAKEVANAPAGTKDMRKPRDGGPRVSAAKNPAEWVEVRGRVLDTDGRPFAGAKLYMKVGYSTRWEAYSREEPSPVGTTGLDGRFVLTAPKAKSADIPTFVTAMAANYGAGWVQIPADGKTDDLTLQLVKDDVPITGQIVDLEGKPVAGATLLLQQINAPPGEDLGPWIEAVKTKKGLDTRLPYPYQMVELKYLPRLTAAVSGKATTDAAGRFRLTGIGRNRLARVQLDGPTIVSQYLRILTRPGATIEATWGGDGQSGIPHAQWAYYGANFRHAAAPTKPIVGVVRDKDTKEPLAGVTIRSLNGLGSGTNVETTTDAQGRYRLAGLSKGKDLRIVAIPPRDLPYVVMSSDVPDTNGLDPVTADLELRRGVWIEGKITDKATGQPVRAAVAYFALSTNPNLGAYRGFDAASLDLGEGKEDGSYRVLGLPGPGLVAVKYDKDRYLRATERNDEYGKESADGFLDTLPLSLMPINYGAVASVDPAKGVRSVKRDMTLDPGWTFTGTVLGPDGKPLAGARGCGLTNRTSRARWDGEARKTAEFTVRSFNPRRPREVFFQHAEMGLVGVVQPPSENGGAVTVRMEPGAAVTGRLVDADGRPRAGVELELIVRTAKDGGEAFGSPQPVQTDPDGRFRIGALLPTYEYQLSDRKGRLPAGAGLGSGKTKDLGDVQIKAEDQ